MTLLEALDDRALFADRFPSPAWDAWRAFLAALFALPMSDAQVERYRAHTGRQDAPTAPAREGWVIVGRRGGKSRIAALLATWFASVDYRRLLAPGEKATIPVIAADRAQARVVFRYICGLVDAVPLLSRLVVRRTASAIEFLTNVVVEVHTCSFRSTRGYTFPLVVADECAFWRDESSASPDVEVLAALRPGLATIPGSLLVAISSPYSRRGALWTAYKDHFGREGNPVLVWKADTASMNPSVDRQVIANAYAADEATASAEYGADFRRDLEAFVSREVIETATIPGRTVLPPMDGIEYVAFTDPSGGSADSFTLAIAHAEERGDSAVAILDCVAERRAPFSPEAVVEELVAVLKRYHVTTVGGDRYAGEWPREAFERHGITYTPSEAAKSELYLRTLPLLNSGRVELLELPRLHAQLLQLERRTTRGGQDVIDHPPRGHDDVANAACGALVAAVAEPTGKGMGILVWMRREYERAVREGRIRPDQPAPTVRPLN